jgi:single-strand DNA-binding protein
MSVNIFIFEGNLGKDPELKFDSKDNPYCTFTMAQTQKKKVKGEETEFVLWAEVTIYGKIASAHAKNLHKGRRVLVNGAMTIDEWTDRNQKNRYTLKIRATEVNYIDEPSRRGAGGEPDQAQTEAADEFSRHDEEKPLTSESIQTPWS